MDQFVCLRLIQANGLDLSLFQFDFDLTFSVFLMNADKTIYARFGSRSDRKDATRDMTLEGFRKTMEGALELHREYPRNKKSLAGKQSQSPLFPVPEAYPALKARYGAELNKDKPVQSCIHCHQIREAERIFYRSQNKPLAEELIFPWPMPDVVGFKLDPKERARVVEVVAGSPAARAGFKAGQDILLVNDQPIISTADFQWILHRSRDGDQLKAVVADSGKKSNPTLILPAGWRRGSDISWRVSTWDLRRKATGGLVLTELEPEKKRERGLKPDDLALIVEYVGQYNDHAVGKKAGFKKDDLIVNFNGEKRRQSESSLLGLLLQKNFPGEKLPVQVQRETNLLILELLMQ